MADEEVYEFLKNKNRPFHVSDIVQNFKKNHGKTAVIKSLDELVSKKKIFVKVYGKQKVYCVVQDETEGDAEEIVKEIEEIDREIKNITSQLNQVDNKLEATSAEIKSLEGKMTTEEAKIKKEKLEVEINQMKVRLEDLKTNSKPINEKEKEKVMKQYEIYMKEYKKRKRMCMDIVNGIMEGYPKTKKQLFEEVEIETDENVGFKID